MTKLANFFYNLPLAPKYMHQQISKQAIDTKILEQDLDTANTTTRRGTKIQKNNLKRKIAAAKRANGIENSTNTKISRAFWWTVGQRRN